MRLPSVRKRGFLAAAVAAALLIAPAGVAAAAPAPVPTGFQPASTSWLTARHGFVFGYAPCSWSDSCQFLFDTNDGGTTWQQLTAPPVALPANSNHVAMTVASDQIALFTDGEYLWETQDGARHWSTVSLAGLDPTKHIDISSVTVFKGSVFAVGTGPDSTVRIYSGAATANTLRPVGRLVATGLPYDYGAVTSVGGVLQIAAGNSYHTGRYWYSADGSTFSAAPVPCPVNSTTPALAGIRSGRVQVVCSADPADPQPGEQVKELVVAPALGRPFVAVGQLPVTGYEQAFATAGATSASVATQAADANLLYATVDGGRTWRNTLTVTDLLGIWDLAFPTAETGYLVAGLPQSPTGASRLYRSTDAGHSWSIMAVK
jgi:hypothetical protein